MASVTSPFAPCFLCRRRNYRSDKRTFRDVTNLLQTNADDRHSLCSSSTSSYHPNPLNPCGFQIRRPPGLGNGENLSCVVAENDLALEECRLCTFSSQELLLKSRNRMSLVSNNPKIDGNFNFQSQKLSPLHLLPPRFCSGAVAAAAMMAQSSGRNQRTENTFLSTASPLR